jgi:hypothetical protein
VEEEEGSRATILPQVVAVEIAGADQNRQATAAAARVRGSARRGER